MNGRWLPWPGAWCSAAQRCFFSVYALEGHRLQPPNHPNLRCQSPRAPPPMKNVKSHVQNVTAVFVFPLTTKVQLGALTVLTSSKWSPRLPTSQSLRWMTRLRFNQHLPLWSAKKLRFLARIVLKHFVSPPHTQAQSVALPAQKYSKHTKEGRNQRGQSWSAIFKNLKMSTSK